MMDSNRQSREGGNPVPSEWITTKLESITNDVSYGYTASSSNDEVGPKMLRITDIQDNQVDWDSVPFCSISTDKKEKYLLQKNDLLFARTGATVGKSYLVKNAPPESVYASYLIRVRTTTDSINSILAHFFNSNQYWQQITEFSSGIGQPNVNGTKLKGLDIPLPPLAEQKVIAEKLDTLLAQVDTTKARLERIPDIIKRFRQSVLAAAVSGKLTEEWRDGEAYSPLEGTIVDFVSIDIGQAFKSKEFTDTGIRLLRGQNIEPGSLKWEETKYYPKKKLTEFSHLHIHSGDIILAMDRPIISTGLKLARAREEDLPCVLVQRVARFKNYRGIDPDFLYLLLQDQSFTNYIQPNQTGSDIPHISGKQILAYRVKVPDTEEQTEIVRRVEELFAFADTIEQKAAAALERVNNLTQSILAKAFRGELTADWRAANPELISGDNSAEALLARIQAEREALALEKKAAKKPRTKQPREKKA
jgi:type I restriction enzyme S subunit